MTATDTTADQMMIRTAYRSLAKNTGEWIGLAALRDELCSLDCGEVDQALRAMVAQPDVNIIPVANMKSLTQADRDAALRLGGEDNHAMRIKN